ncbi:MAG TPA: aminotransferase class V-fold PLP-dependent enzyme [Polyangiaceae bacterium]|jgi:selenocysteine lyase/cysteine desulfurase
MTAARRALELRAEFPVLARCLYLNSNSTGAVPRGVEGVLAAYWETISGWRDEVWERWWRELHEYADAVAAFVGAPPGTVVTDVNLSSLLGRLLGALQYGDRPKIVTTDLEFPTVPFLLAAQRRHGAVVHTVGSRDGASIELEDLLPAIDERTRLVCLSHASYTTGALVDLPAVVRRARSVGAWVAVDAYQSVGVVPIDVSALGVDFLLGGAHKWMCGSIESAFLYVHPSRTAQLEPAATGWMASRDPLSFGAATEYAATARRFAAGTPAVLPALVSHVALRILAELGIDAIRQASLRMTSRVLARALEAGLDVATPHADERRGGIVCLRFPGDAAAVAALKQRGMVCSHRGGVRVAPHFYNTDDEVDAFMDALLACARASAS